MKIPIRFRLTFLFVLLSSLLLLLSSLFIYARVSRNLHKAFEQEMIHDGRLMAELFKEEWKLNAIDEFREELKEFNFDLQISDAEGHEIVRSEAWPELNIKRIVVETPHFEEVHIRGVPYGLFRRLIYMPDQTPFLLQMVRSQVELHKTLKTLLERMLIVNPFMILVAGLFGFGFTRRMLNAEQKAFEQLKKFTADASHELRIPLTSLRGHLEVALRKERSPQEYRDTIQNALEEAEHLSQLTKDLLFLAQGDANKISLNRQSVSLKTLTADIFQQMEFFPDEKNIQKILHPIPDVQVSLDPDRIQQLLLNLMDNAIKYGRVNGSMSLSAAVKNNAVVFVVKDDGIGISKDDQEKIFDRFYRADKARSREQGGSGLGLSIVKWIVDAHGGWISLESELGRGSVFTVVLPLA